MLYHISIRKYCPILLLPFHFLNIFKKNTSSFSFLCQYHFCRHGEQTSDNLQEMWQALTPQSGSVRRVRILHLCEEGGAVIGTCSGQAERLTVQRRLCRDLVCWPSYRARKAGYKERWASSLGGNRETKVWGSFVQATYFYIVWWPGSQAIVRTWGGRIAF